MADGRRTENDAAIDVECDRLPFPKETASARNALAAMIDYIMSEYGYDRPQAYMIASIAVDMRIGQLVDVPNVGVTAVLPLDIFVGND